MKKILSFVALATLFVGCNNEEFYSALNVYSLKGYAYVESRTAFGSPTDNSIPFEWCAGDKVYVGNVQSNPLTNGGSSATFTFGTTPTETNVYYNMTGSSATDAKVKSEQTVGNLGENGDFGYGTISNGSFTLQHAMAYVWFDVTLPDGATLEKVTLNAGEAVIAGTTTWNGSSFGTVNNGSSSIDLTVNKRAITGAEVAMVVLPTTISNATVTYQLNVGEKTKYYQQALGQKTLSSGTTYKVTTDLSTVELYELRVLTFEDGTEKFEPYECLFSYAMNFTEEYKWIENWSDYIPRDGQYGNGHGAYEWYDEGNTELAFVKPTIDSWWGISGHAGISNYVGTDEDINQYHDDDNMLFMIDLQAYNVAGGANGSKNFCSQYGYLDPDDYATQYSPEGVLPGIQFYDEVARVIDYMYVTNTTYAYGVIINDECDFGGSYEYTDESTFKIVAYGYDSFDDTEPTMTEFYLLNTGKRIVTDWTKWDLSVLGKVVRVEFNLIACYQGYGNYGLVIPAYFAYDDVAVRFTETAE